jgi:hypothetical protein
LNILSISKFIKQRAIVHFEEGNCYIKIDSINHPTPIPIVQVDDGMFKIKCNDVEDFELNPVGSIKTDQSASKSFTISGKSFATSADLTMTQCGTDVLDM